MSVAPPPEINQPKYLAFFLLLFGAIQISKQIKFKLNLKSKLNHEPGQAQVKLEVVDEDEVEIGS